MAFAQGLNKKHRRQLGARQALTASNAARSRVIARKKNVRGGITMGIPQNEGFVPLEPIEARTGRKAYQAPTKHGVKGARGNLQQRTLQRAMKLGKLDPRTVTRIRNLKRL